MNLWFEISDEGEPSDDAKTIYEFQAMLDEIRPILKKHGWGLASYIPTPGSQLVAWYGAGRPEDNSFPGIEHFVHERFMPDDAR